jgi:ribosome-binding factor A
MLDRMDKVSEALKREIMVILQEEINDPRVRHVTIMRVEVTRDLNLAKVFYVISEEESGKEAVAKGLHKASGFIRGQLAERLPLKVTPQISFREDREKEREEAVERLFEKIKKEHHEAEGDDAERTADGHQ